MRRGTGKKNMNWINDNNKDNSQKRGNPLSARKFLFPVVSIVLSILLVAVVSEIVLRISGYSPSNVNPLGAFHEFDSNLGHRGRRLVSGHFRRPEFDALITHDENGFRRQEYQNKASLCEHDVFVFGDSFTWGWGVDQGEGFTDRMSLLIPAYCVHNYGIDSTGTAVQYILFDKEVKKSVKPGDTVVVMFFENDFDDNVAAAEVKNGQVELLKRKRPSDRFIDRNLKKISYFYNFMAYKIDLFQLNRKRKKEISIARALMASGGQDPRNIMEKHFLAAFKKACADLKANFLLVYIPGQAELSESDIMRPEALANEQAYRKALFSIADSLDIKTLDLLPYFLGYKKNNNNMVLTFKRDEHWNPTGHKLAAKIISDYILKNKKL